MPKRFFLSERIRCFALKGGKPPKLTVEGKLYITLKRLRERRTA
jgi:hypothetical protein